ncbi:MAG TPA: NFACT RNA binding domain-containing protein, partial [Cytophagaceae bacterium]|nr:NFACT RNA binding domain-containing protein [Cytophagaceae bacterium]
YLLAMLGSDFSCLYLPKDFHKARNNAIPYFQEVKGAKVTDLVQAKHERAFYLVFDNGFKLLFKLFGNRANLILFDINDQIRSLFKRSLAQDKQISLQSIDRGASHSLEDFISAGMDLHKTFFTLGKIASKYLRGQNYENSDPKEKYKLLQNTLSYLAKPEYFITRVEDKVILSLFNIGEIISIHQSAAEALNHFYQAHYRFNHLEKLKQEVLLKINNRIRSSRIFILKSSERIKELEAGIPVEEIANIIMANLHAIPAGSEKVTLFDFYRSQDIDIPLKKDLSPQKNAGILYRKSKNRPLEITRLKKNLADIESRIKTLMNDLSAVEKLDHYKELDLYFDKYIRKPETAIAEAEDLFKTYDYQGYKIFVGKNAGNNDELTQKFAHKEDLWLHAKDVSGSHVVIRHQAGKKIPGNVIEKAAQLAAWYSKRKNDSLCPVIYTLKKYVRKQKGAAKGAVKVDRENVLMVVPADF